MPMRPVGPDHHHLLRLASVCALIGALLDPGAPVAAQRQQAAGPSTVPAEELTPVRAFRAFDKRRTPTLPQSTVMGMHQDDRGILWLATLDGLATFDGTVIEPIPATENAPVHGALRSIAGRDAGGIYVGATHEVFVFDGTRWTVIEAPGGTESLVEGRGGELWRVDREGKAWHLGPGAPPWRTPTLPADIGRGVAVTTGPGGDVWLAGRDAVLRRRGASWTSAATGATPPGPITSMHVASDGTCWIGTEDGRVAYAASEAQSWTTVPLPGWVGGRVRVLSEDRRGRMWAGGFGGGVAHGTKDLSRPWQVWGLPNGLKREASMAILADREGTIWFSANGHGLQQWVGEGWTHRNTWTGDDSGYRRVQVFGVTPTSDGGLLAAVFDRGIWHWDGTRVRQYGREQGITEHVRSAAMPDEQTIWVGARYKAFESTDGGKSFHTLFEVPGGFVFGFDQGPDGTWYASTSIDGVWWQRAGRWQRAEAINAELPDLAVRSLLWHSNGELWLGTINQGAVVIGRDGKRRPLDESETRANPSAVHALLEVEGDVWAGGFGGIGVLAGESSRFLTSEDGVPGNSVYGLARAPDGTVWVGGSAGVGSYVDGRFTDHGGGTGLLEEECNHRGLAVGSDGTVYVGTMASLARFDATLPALERPALRLFWRDRPTAADPTSDDVPRLPANERSVRLSWRAPWLASQPIEYRFRIPRRSLEWSPPQAERFVQLEELGPRKWEVHVAARFVGEEAWTESLVTHFTITPRLWETHPFRLAVALAGLGLLAAFVHWRTRRLRRRASELEEAVQTSLAEIKVLGGLLPICSGCKMVRDDAGYWQQIESYIRDHSEAQFSHGLCPSCLTSYYPELDEDDTQVRNLIQAAGRVKEPPPS